MHQQLKQGVCPSDSFRPGIRRCPRASVSSGVGFRSLCPLVCTAHKVGDDIEEAYDRAMVIDSAPRAHGAVGVLRHGPPVRGLLLLDARLCGAGFVVFPLRLGRCVSVRLTSSEGCVTRCLASAGRLLFAVFRLRCNRACRGGAQSSRDFGGRVWPSRPLLFAFAVGFRPAVFRFDAFPKLCAHCGCPRCAIASSRSFLRFSGTATAAAPSRNVRLAPGFFAISASASRTAASRPAASADAARAASATCASRAPWGAGAVFALRVSSVPVLQGSFRRPALVGGVVFRGAVDASLFCCVLPALRRFFRLLFLLRRFSLVRSCVRLLVRVSAGPFR